MLQRALHIPLPLGFVVDNVVIEQAFLQVIWLPPPTIISLYLYYVDPRSRSV